MVVSAAESERLAQEYPEEREELLREAAADWSGAGEHERALTLYEQLLEGECGSRHLIEAYRVSELWATGQHEQAREAATVLRAQHPKDGMAWNVVAEVFEDAGDLGSAEQWFTAGVTHLLGPTASLTLDDVQGTEHFFDVSDLLIGRHRVRRHLRRPHDGLDDLAHQVHEQRQITLSGRVRSLDELHDPAKEAEILQEENELLRAREAELIAEVADLQASRPRQQARCVFYLPPRELTLLLERYPALGELYGSDHAGHRRRLEEALLSLSDLGHARLGVAPGTVAGLEAYAREEGVDPDEWEAGAGYAADLGRLGRAVDWPPPRNGPCWCGSGNKYKKCCGSPAFLYSD